jgi:type II restriction/modification system DNA methylase subunit YeeA
MESYWYPLSKGGDFRKWFGNNEHVINLRDDGWDIKNGGGNYRLREKDLYFKPYITWSRISSSQIAFRYLDQGVLFADAAPGIFAKNNCLDVLAFLNSKLCDHFLKGMNPTLNFQTNDIESLPYFDAHSADIAKELIKLSKFDWDSFEGSWDFEGLPYLSATHVDVSLPNSWKNWQEFSIKQLKVAKELEEQNNSVFITAYGLQDELSPEVPQFQITLTRADREKDSQRLISYAIGCMMGRYSLDEPGLIYAHAGNADFNPGRYSSFPADADGIIPITDELWFDEDASNRIREFLCTVWGPDTLEENMLWLAESLGTKPGETSDETIRRYIADKFFKDHLQTYKKRPIYWLFSSGKQGAFQALVYLHRYNEGTLARMRAEYVVPLTSKIQSRIEMLEKDVSAASSTPARNKLAKEMERLKKKHIELLAYDEQLRHYADMRITLDLDDGVKVNYGKFGDLLAEVKAIAGGAADE